MKMNFSYLCIILLVIIVILLWYILKNINEEQEYYISDIKLNNKLLDVNLENKNDVCRQFYDQYYDNIKMNSKKNTSINYIYKFNIDNNIEEVEENDEQFKKIKNECSTKLNNYIIDSLTDLPKEKCLNNDMIYEVRSKEDIDMCYREPNYKYHRDYFLNGWDDVNKDGCDTRSEILAKYSEIKPEYLTNGNKEICKIKSGEWNSYYTLHEKDKNIIPYTYKSTYGPYEKTFENKSIESTNKHLYYIPKIANINNCTKFDDRKKNEIFKSVLKNYNYNNPISIKDIEDVYLEESKSTTGINRGSIIPLLNKKDNCLVEIKEDSDIKDIKLVMDESFRYEENDDIKNTQILDIDHIVPLENAWFSGGWNWKPWQMKSYANDMTPGHLEVSPAGMNRSKSDKPINKWIPSIYNNSNSKPKTELKNIKIDSKANCEYASNYAAVKYRWNLGITDREKDTLKTIVNHSKCKGIMPKSTIDFSNKGLSLKNSEIYSELSEYNMTNPLNLTLTNLQNQYKTFCFKNETDSDKIKNLKKDILKNSEVLQIWNTNYFKKYFSTNKDKLCSVIFPDINNIINLSN